MTYKNRSWYKNLKQSKLTPPDKTFGIVWPILYALLLTYFILMLGEKKCVGICKPLIPFIIQIIINVFWSPVFFQLKKPLLAFIMILVMLLHWSKRNVQSSAKCFTCRSFILKIWKRQWSFAIDFLWCVPNPQHAWLTKTTWSLAVMSMISQSCVKFVTKSTSRLKKTFICQENGQNNTNLSYTTTCVSL